MKNTPDVSIIIQGPLNPISLEHIANYAKFGKVIVSAWTTCDYNLLNRANGPYTFTKSQWTYERANVYYNEQNILRQTVSTLAGLDKVETQYTIKVRSDEYYSDLSEFIDKVTSTNKLVTNNVFFRKDSEFKFHPSDHVIGTRTEDLKATFTTVEKWCKKAKDKNRFNIKEVIDVPLHVMVAETLICLAYIKYRTGSLPVPDASVALMKRYVDVVPVSQMGNFRCSATCFDKSYHSIEDFKDGRELLKIESMDDL